MSNYHWALEKVVESTVLPFTIDEVKEHLRVYGNDDDAYIAQLVPTVLRIAEKITRRTIAYAQWKLYLDVFPSGDIICLPNPPLVSVSSVKYYDSNNTLQTYDSANYTVDAVSEPGRMVKVFGETWPTTYQKPNAVEILFFAGWQTAEEIPVALRQALLFHLGLFFEHRLPVVVGPNVVRVPGTIQMLYEPYRVVRFF